MIYADHAATTPLCPAALAAMTDCLRTYYGNPSSAHRAGADAARALLRAREDMARALGCTARELFFTAGGTEADNQALATAAAWGAAHGRRHFITSAFEHPAVSRMLDTLETQGFCVTRLSPAPDGMLYPDQVEAALRDDTCCVSVMLANNEIGTIQPLAAISALCRARGVLVHTDAVQAVGHIPIDFVALGVDLLALSAHKFGGPKGAGALCVRRGLAPVSLLHGGGQERGARAGTENLPAIVGMAAALTDAAARLSATHDAVAALRAAFEDGLSALSGVHVLGASSPRVPGITGCCFAGVESETLLLVLDADGICVSAGSACASGALEASPTLRALGVPDPLARGFLRFSLGADNTPADVETILASTRAAVARLRKDKP